MSKLCNDGYDLRDMAGEFPSAMQEMRVRFSYFMELIIIFYSWNTKEKSGE